MIELDNLSRPMAPGVIELPKTQIAITENIKKEELRFGKTKNQKIMPLLESNSALMSRFHAGRIDLTYSLMADHHGEAKSQETIGRLWSMHYPSAWNFSDGGTFPTVKMELAPAFAGFKHGLQDQAAMRALTAMSASLRSVPNEMIPDDARATINTLLTAPAQMSRMLLRFATLWAAAAAAELAGNSLVCHSNSDDRMSTAITTLGDFTIALKSITRQNVQPLLVNIRGSVEGMRYMRIARILCLDRPALALEDGHEAPSVTKLWPPIPNARAYQLAPNDQLLSMAGPVSSRDIAILASYYARCLNVAEQLEDWVQFAASMVYRPAGSALHGRHQAAILQLPPAVLGPTILMPLVQAVDTLDDERIMAEMDEPAITHLYGACQASVYLAALNNTSQTALGDAAHHLTGALKNRCLLHQRNLAVRTMNGTPIVCSAINLAGKQGWDASFSHAWLALSPMSELCMGKYFPVESEETMPWVTALPSTCAMLGTLLPVHLETAPASDAYLRVSAIAGRVGLTDALYGLQALGAEPAIYYTVKTRAWPPPPVRYTILKGYRGMPTDGQFAPHTLDDTSWQPLFRLESHGSLLKAMRGHQARSLWHWSYEWHVPYSSSDAAVQYVEHAAVPAAMSTLSKGKTPSDDLIVVKDAPSVKYPAGPVGDPGVLRDVLGDAWGRIMDTRGAMKAMVGKQLENNRYENLAREFAGCVTGLLIDQITVIMPPEYHTLMWTWLYNYSVEAATWVTSPGMQTECSRVADFCVAQLGVDMPALPPPDIERKPPNDDAGPLPSGPTLPPQAGTPPRQPDFPSAPSTSAAGAVQRNTAQTGSAGSAESALEGAPQHSPTQAAAGGLSDEERAIFEIQDAVFGDPQASSPRSGPSGQPPTPEDGVPTLYLIR
jgi:hypothetical protein